MECTLGEIVGASGSKLHKNLTGLPGPNTGTIIMSAEELGSSKVSENSSLTITSTLTLFLR